jgi:hypothetical protein
LEQMPHAEAIIEVVMPKKAAVYNVKWFDLVSIQFLIDSKEHLSFLACNGELLFIQLFDGQFMPTLRLLHKCWLPACWVC